MSRIPVPSQHQNTMSFPQRALSPTPGSVSHSTLSGSNTDTRMKQSRRDEAIRKKIESELARKRTISTAGGGSRQKKGGKAAAKGTVAALKPSQALTVPDNITVADASQLCAAKRTDCVLVVDEEEGLSGIFTAKDLAFRVTAEGLDPRTTLVSKIMTPNPMVTRDTTSATEALQLMVQKGFRHLPVCNEDGNVVGLLDITKVFHEALEKNVQSELGEGVAANPQAAAMLAFVESLRDKTALPDLTTVMDARTHPATVGPRTTVREAAKLMKENRTTAVCVMEAAAAGGGPPKIAGIFTSKDIVLRVIAAGLDPGRCSVVRVMTPHPDVAPPNMTIQDALKKMYNGHYLNLPVVESDGRLVAIVDVLKLTYATLEQMNTLADAGHAEAEGGPMWGRFFESIGHDDNDSVVSGSHVMRDMTSPGFDRSEVYPGDSASMVDNESEYPGGNQSIGGAHSAISKDNAPPPPVDDGTYVFKFSSPSGRTHRFQARKDNFENLKDIISGKLTVDPFFTEYAVPEGGKPLDPTEFHILYKDSDGDIVVMTGDGDVSDAVAVARQAGSDRVVLTIQGGKGWSLDDPKSKAAAEEATKKLKEEAEKAEAAATEPKPKGVRFDTAGDDLFGIPRDLVLPASLGALAVVIIAVFTIHRLSD
ncbi:CBS-domain-containing protein [Serendipita vermifera]|nr:CBS-domain-containing protein [Serendipita vermifera]